MRKLLLAAFLLAISFTTQSATDGSGKYCKNLYQLAENIMSFRQDGVSMVKKMDS